MTEGQIDMTTALASIPEMTTHTGLPQARRTGLTGKLYRYHGMQVIDIDGRSVGQIDWIWADPAGAQGEFIGVQLRWLRGKARVVPAYSVWIDAERRTIQVPYSKAQIECANRYSIDRALTAEQKDAICGHFTAKPTVVPGRAVGYALAA
jgi:hypothetical protein